jgi:hypothetical protein
VSTDQLMCREDLLVRNCYLCPYYLSQSNARAALRQRSQITTGYTSNVSGVVEQHELSSENVYLVLYMRGEHGSELRKVSTKSHIITFR